MQNNMYLISETTKEIAECNAAFKAEYYVG